jgi:hypothetical protein
MSRRGRGAHIVGGCATCPRVVATAVVTPMRGADAKVAPPLDYAAGWRLSQYSAIPGHMPGWASRKGVSASRMVRGEPLGINGGTACASWRRRRGSWRGVWAPSLPSGPACFTRIQAVPYSHARGMMRDGCCPPSTAYRKYRASLARGNALFFHALRRKELVTYFRRAVLVAARTTAHPGGTRGHIHPPLDLARDEIDIHAIPSLPGMVA